MSSIIRTSGCIISVDTKKDETRCFGAFRSLSRAKRKEGMKLSKVERLLSKVKRLIISPKAKRKTKNKDRVKVNGEDNPLSR